MPKLFHPTYLYVKTHNITGLKYFGKTTKNDPEKYKGSGSYWLNHLKIHGNDVSTEIIGFYIDKDECIKAAQKFSIENNIVNALDSDNKKIWANLIIENGTDGGIIARKYSPHTEETKLKISKANKGQIPWNKNTIGLSKGNTKERSKETKEKISKALTGLKHSLETIQKRANSLRGQKRPEMAKKIKGKKHTEEAKARMRLAHLNKKLSEETKIKIRNTVKGKKLSEEAKAKLRDRVIVINKAGILTKISKSEYYSQIGPKEDWEWLSHKAKEAQLRKRRG